MNTNHEFNEFDIFAPDLRAIIEAHQNVYHVALESGNFLSFNVLDQEEKIVTDYLVTMEDVGYALNEIVRYNQADVQWTDNTTGFNKQLVRIVGIFNRGRKSVTGLAIRFGRSIPDAHNPIQDLLDKRESVLIMGQVGSRKTTMLRSGAGYLGKRWNVTLLDGWISDLSSGGEGFVHPDLMGVSILRGTYKQRAEEALRSIQGLLPQWLVLDEISHTSDVDLVSTASRKGVAIFGTCHGKDLRDFVNNHIVRRVAGEFNDVLISGSVMRERGLSQQSITERTGTSAFKYLVQIVDVDIYAVYNMAEAVDDYLNELDPQVEIRSKLGIKRSTMNKLDKDVAVIKKTLVEMGDNVLPKPIMRVYAPDLKKKDEEAIMASYSFISLVPNMDNAEVAILSPSRYEKMMGQQFVIPIFINTGKIGDVLQNL